MTAYLDDWGREPEPRWYDPLVAVAALAVGFLCYVVLV